MKPIIYPLLLCFAMQLLCCNVDKTNIERNQINKKCDLYDSIGSCETNKEDSLFIIHQALSFAPSSLELSKAINEDKQISTIIEKIREKKMIVSGKCLNKFVLIVLLKMYCYHLNTAHQGFDLLQMCDDDNSKFIVDCFMREASLSDKIEMLNSGYVYEYFKNNHKKMSKEELEIVSQIKSLEEMPIEFENE